MLTQLKVTNYRGFRSFVMNGLTRVNLLVGKNNSGKSTLLECFNFLMSQGEVNVMSSIARGRGEFTQNEGLWIDVALFFFGREFALGSRFMIEGDSGFAPITVNIAEGKSDAMQETIFDDPPLQIEFRRGDPFFSQFFPLTEDGTLLLDPRYSRRPAFDEKREGSPVVVVTGESTSSTALGKMWNKILRDKREDLVYKAMQILEPQLEDIVFQTSEATRVAAARISGILIGLAESSRRVPLGNLGEGMRHLLELSISLVDAHGGFLIIDEIDTGFHYSIMAKLWELVVRTAIEENIQVFASTHSADCVRGLGALCAEYPELQEQVSVHKIDRALESSIPFGGADVRKAVEHDIELR